MYIPHVHLPHRGPHLNGCSQVVLHHHAIAAMAAGNCRLWALAFAGQGDWDHSCRNHGSEATISYAVT